MKEGEALNPNTYSNGVDGVKIGDYTFNMQKDGKFAIYTNE